MLKTVITVIFTQQIFSIPKLLSFTANIYLPNRVKATLWNRSVGISVTQRVSTSILPAKKSCTNYSRCTQKSTVHNIFFKLHYIFTKYFCTTITSMIPSKQVRTYTTTIQDPAINIGRSPIVFSLAPHFPKTWDQNYITNYRKILNQKIIRQSSKNYFIITF